MRVFRLIYQDVVLKKTKDDSFTSYQKLLDLKSNLCKSNPEYVKLKRKAEDLKREIDFINSKIRNMYIISIFEE